MRLLKARCVVSGPLSMRSVEPDTSRGLVRQYCAAERGQSKRQDNLEIGDWLSG